MDIERLQTEIIGGKSMIQTPYGTWQMTYADYTASGRNLRFLEEEMLQIEALYANTHTEDNQTGSQTTVLYHAAKERIRTLLGGNEDYVVVMTGTGATGAILRLTQILGIYEAPATRARQEALMSQFAASSSVAQKVLADLQQAKMAKRPVVFITPYEHHSNVLPWREGDAEVVELNLTADGDLDLADLDKMLRSSEYQNRLKIGSFSAASNVTGMISPVQKLAEIMHTHGGYAFFDFAASAPYVEITAYEDETHFMDGLIFSPHKFIGGPGTSGCLMFHKRIYNTSVAPCSAGGGTVEYVSSHGHDYKTDIEAREDAGTPAILQTIRAARVLEIKSEIGVPKIESIEHHYLQRALQFFHTIPQIILIGQDHPNERLAIVSFNIRYKDGLLHPRFVVRLLNDLFGIQGRAGCSCAGPYGHRLLGIDEEKSSAYRSVILQGVEAMKPGWVRVNFHYLLQESTFQFLLDAIAFVSKYGHLFLADYQLDVETGLWTHIKGNRLTNDHNDHLVEDADKYKDYLHRAHLDIEKRHATHTGTSLFGYHDWPELAWFHVASSAASV